MLRNGNVHSAEDWQSVLEPVAARYRDQKIERFFRADAAFANPKVYEFLEKEEYRYAIRLPANDVLQREINPELPHDFLNRLHPMLRRRGQELETGRHRDSGRLCGG